MINKLGEAGIYTLVDAHQDVFARSICGEGVPDFWAKKVVGDNPVCVDEFLDKMLERMYEKLGICQDMKDYEYRMDENDDPLIEDCQQLMFANYYSTKQSVTAFDALLRNKEGIQDAFIAYWDRTSARFAKNPYVVGFDPLNEPLAGNMYKYPENQVPGYTDKEFLAPMYEKIYEKYRANDEDAIMWFEPVVHPDITAEEPAHVYPVGFDTPPGADIGSSKHILNDHTYCCQLNSTVCASGEPDPAKADDCLAWHYERISTRDKDAKRLGVPLMISEFGACLTEGPCKQEID